jgi:hypothetical protein
MKRAERSLSKAAFAACRAGLFVAFAAGTVETEAGRDTVGDIGSKRELFACDS